MNVIVVCVNADCSEYGVDKVCLSPPAEGQVVLCGVCGEVAERQPGATQLPVEDSP